MIPAQARTQEKPVRVFGEGTISCGKWLQDRETKSINGAEAEAWVRGFLTGTNAASDDAISSVGTGADPEGNNAWLDNYCRRHSLERLYEAAMALRAALWAAGRR
jgi:hypothetical protein